MENSFLEILKEVLNVLVDGFPRNWKRDKLFVVTFSGGFLYCTCDTFVMVFEVILGNSFQTDLEKKRFEKICRVLRCS